MGAFVIYFNVNFNVLKQIHCALVGIIKDWIIQNAGYRCGKKKEERNDWKCGTCEREERNAYKILLEKSKGR